MGPLYRARVVAEASRSITDIVSAIGRYRPVYPRLWRHPGFTGLTKSARELVLYLLTGPQTNRIGLFHLSAATASEDLSVSIETVRKGLADVAVTFGWTFDGRARVFFIPSWWRWNPPANENVLKGNLKDLNEIPPSPLVERFALNLETLPETFRETFVECCSKRLRERSPTQEQYQYQDPDQELNQEPRRQRTASHRSRRSSPLAFANDQRNGSEEKLLATAREVLTLTNPNLGLDHLLDAFRSISKEQSFDREAVTKALNVALSERRTADAAVS